MENNPIQREQEEETQLVPLIRTCYRQFVRHWWWFVLSIVVCVVVGWIYQQRQARVYQRQSVMLIEDTDPSSFGSSTSSRRMRRSGSVNTLLELNGVSVGDNLKNEVFILSSQRLMKRVVERLNLTTDYTTTSALHTIALYGKERPFEVIFQKPIQGVRAKSFMVEKADDGSVTLSDMYDKDGNEAAPITARLGEMVNTPAGKLCVVRGPGYGKWIDDAIKVTHMPLEMAADRYLSGFSAEEYDKETSLIVLTCSDINQQRATDVLNALFDVYKEDVVENKNRVALNTGKFIDQRLELISRELGNVETQLADFKKQNNLVDFESSVKTVVDQTADARQQTLQTETQLNVAQYLAEYLKETGNEHDLIPALSIGDASFNTQISEYNKLMNTRNLTLANSSEKQTVVADFDRQLSGMRKSILASVENYINTLSLKLKDARDNEAILTGKIAGAPDQEKKGLDIQRQQSLKEALYTYLLNKREEVALQQAINEANVRLVEGPLGSHMPVAPRTKIILLIALAVGVLIPSGIIYMMMMFDVTIHNREEIEKVTSIPILGEIPHLKSSHQTPIITELETNAPVVEAFRILRFNLGFIRHDTQVLTVTSSTPGQGKSFVTTNLAIVLAMAGKRVLLIDADIRKQTISKHHNYAVGLTSYIADEHSTTDDIIQRVRLADKIDFIPAGPMPPNPSELLMSPRFDALINELRGKYDHIIIDTTPMFAVADANIVGRVADLTLFIVRMGVQNRDILPTLEQMYQDERFKHLCMVLNDTDEKHSSYGYGYGYGRGE